ncbi:MAG: phage tail protein [Halodesulfovibrio sp.]|uniref:phage tail protein n=1 Tax=Halodesulfovibrio sp. TaxID=1912772 RepID=UPI00359EDD68
MMHANKPSITQQTDIAKFKRPIIVEPTAMMKLGDFVFSLNTAAFQSMSRSSSYNWAEQARIGTHPCLQFTGVGAETICLPGIILPRFKGGLKQVVEMRVLAGHGKPLQLMDGFGDLKGFWCITSIKEDASDFLAGGYPQKIEFTLELKYYGEKA